MAWIMIVMVRSMRPSVQPVRSVKSVRVKLVRNHHLVFVCLVFAHVISSATVASPARKRTIKKSVWRREKPKKIRQISVTHFGEHTKNQPTNLFLRGNLQRIDRCVFLSERNVCTFQRGGNLFICDHVCGGFFCRGRHVRRDIWVVRSCQAFASHTL